MEEIPKVEGILGELEVGREYMVPCLDSTHLGWVPVIPFIHQDPELSNPRNHVHYDYRFFDDDLRGQLLKTESKSAAPVLNTASKETYTLRKMVCTYPDNRVDPCFLQRKGAVFIKGLDNACKDKVFKGRICPHKGYSLEGVRPNSQGIITCPLHGARWNTDGSYAGSTILSETFLARYIAQNAPTSPIELCLYGNDVEPHEGILLKDIEDVTGYDPILISDFILQMDPRPRMVTDKDEVVFKIHGQAAIAGYYFKTVGWDKPLWMERFHEDCNPTFLRYTDAGGTLHLRLLKD